jgi:ubiquitin carboxyl-terminal hydrolase 22/27/51
MAASLPLKRHACGCTTLEPKNPPCRHITPEILKNLGVASHYVHTVTARRTGAAPAADAAAMEDALSAICCSACTPAERSEDAGGGERPAYSACLQCFFIGCRHRGHLEQHFAASGHTFALDLELRQVYCRSCRCYVHNRELEQQLELGRRKVMRHHRRLGQQDAPSAAASKPPTMPSAAALKEQAYARSSNAQILGLRGMVNMGNTCFMSSILQALVHNPFMRTVFLSDCEWSPAKTVVVHSPRAGETSAGGGASPPLRFDFLRLFTEMYSGDTSPHAPYYLLHTVWKHSAYLSGYQQQDAHEFLIFILNQLHAQMQVNVPDADTKVKVEPKTSSSGAPTKPSIVLSPAGRPGAKSESVISRVFRGTLRSDVACCGCGAVSTAYDPFFDLPLDLAGRSMPPPSQAAAGLGQTAATAAGAAAASSGAVTPRTPRAPGSAITLSDCLHSFTRTEELESDGQWVCAACKSPNKRTKRLSIATLPMILVLQVKRFAKTVVPSGKGNGQSQVVSHKLEQHIKFPTAGLDLRPYTSAELFSRKQDLQATSAGGSGGKRAERVSALLQPAYTLFSVVVHYGTLEQGGRCLVLTCATSLRLSLRPGPSCSAQA